MERDRYVAHIKVHLPGGGVIQVVDTLKNRGGLRAHLESEWIANNNLGAWFEYVSIDGEEGEVWIPRDAVVSIH